MSLDLTSLDNAIARLCEALEVYGRDTGQSMIRDSVVKRFEFTYELAHKMLKRGLETGAPSPEQYDRMAFPDLIRSGNEQGLLLSDWPVWKQFREMRNKTSHSYDEAVALEVIAGIAGFLRDATFLRDQLRERFT